MNWSEVAPDEFLFCVLREFAANAAESAAYKNWSGDYALKNVVEVWENQDATMRKKKDRRLAIAELQSIPIERLQDLGFGKWKLDDGREICLIPLWAWNYIDTSVVIDINGKEGPPSEKVPDHRGGCTAYGFLLEKPLFTKPLSSYGDLMTREEFRGSVECGFFTNDDGSAHISNGVMEGHSINVSLQSIDRLPPDVTHIMWFNK